MKTTNRDLLVLVKDESMNQRQIEVELEKLNSLLFQLETGDSFCVAHEIFDITKHKVVDNRKKIVQIIHQPELKPFQFICNKN
jgi:hypothetical protein